MGAVMSVSSDAEAAQRSLEILGAGVALIACGRRWPRVGAGVSGALLAPSFVAVLHRGDVAGMVVLAACIVLVSLRQGALPSVVPASVVCIGCVEAIRAHVASRGFAPAGAAVAPLLLAGVGVAGAAALPAVPRFAGLIVGAAGVVLGLGVASQAAKEGGDELLERLDAVVTNPKDHAAAVALSSSHGVGLPLQVGWAPSGATLTPTQRVEAARWLEAHGRGGEGRRLLRMGRGDANIAWWWVLSRRMEGLPDVPGVRTRAPDEAFPMPGGLSLDVAMLTDGARSWLLDVRRPCSLSLRARGDAWRGPAEIAVSVDGLPPQRFLLGEEPESYALKELTVGPHRVRIRFDNDLAGTGGDRNVYLDALDCPAG